MVPMQVLSLEHYVGHNSEHPQTDALLQNFQLHEIERPAVSTESHPVGRYLAAIFKESDAPREYDDS